MATHDYVIDNSTGANVRADINSVLQAILTNNSSSSAPSTTAAYMFWADTTSGTLKIRNSSDNAWVELLQLDGTLTLEDGSASTPGLSFRDDLDTGIFSGGANEFNIATGGTERFVLDSSGNCGIGTTNATPSNGEGMCVGSSSSIVRLDLRNSTTGDVTGDGTSLQLNGNDFTIENRESGFVAFATALSERMRIDSSGKLAVGTTTPYTYGIATFNDSNGIVLEGSSQGRLLFRHTGGGTNLKMFDLASSDGVLKFRTLADNGTSVTERMRIDSSGNVIIGTTSARANFFNVTSLSANLQIEGANNNLQRGISHTYGNASANGPYLILAKHRSDSVGGTTVVQNSDEIGMLSFQGSDGTHFVECARIMGEIDGTPGADDMPGRLRFLTTSDGAASPTERMRIDSSGNLIVGGTSAQASDAATLMADGEVTAPGFYFSNNQGSAMNSDGIRRATTNTMVFDTNSTERMRIDGSGNIGVNTTSPSHKLDISQDGVAFPSAAGSTVLRLRNSGGSTTLSIDSNAGNAGAIQFGDTSASSQGTILYHHASNHMQFNTTDTERMRINSSGRVLIAETTTADVDAFLTVQVGGASTAGITTHSGTTGNRHAIACCNDNGHVGGITTSGSTTSFNTSSDYRLKENATAISDGISRLKTLKPYRFNWKVDSSTTVDGFFAHEVTAVPEAITGTKDEVDENNKPVYQGIDQSKLVPLLVAAVQELITKVETLEAA